MTSLALVILMTGTDATLAADPAAVVDSTPTLGLQSVTTAADASTTAAEARTIADASTTAATISTVDPGTKAAVDATTTAAARPPIPAAAIAIAAPPAAVALVPVSAVLVAFARSHLRARYRHYATGPSSFDCSGLMWRVFKEAGLGRKVSSRNARGIYLAYRARGLASRTNPQVGDLVVWGHGSHVGVYVGRGNAISALVQGVRVHRVNAMFTPFTAYLHTHLAGVSVPAWKLALATHARSVRHTTHATILRAAAGSSAASMGRIGVGIRFVVVARQRDRAGRLWHRILTFRGRTGWLLARITAR